MTYNIVQAIILLHINRDIDRLQKEKNNFENQIIKYY